MLANFNTGTVGLALIGMRIVIACISSSNSVSLRGLRLESFGEGNSVVSRRGSRHGFWKGRYLPASLIPDRQSQRDDICTQVLSFPRPPPSSIHRQAPCLHRSIRCCLHKPLTMAFDATIVSCGILSTPDPIHLPPDPTRPALSALCAARGMTLPLHPTLASLIKLVASYNANLRLGGDYNVKAMLLHSKKRAGGAALRRCVVRDLISFRHALVHEQRASRVHPALPTVRAVPTAPPLPVGASSILVSPPRVDVSPDTSDAMMAVSRARLAFEMEQHRVNMELAKRRLDFQERCWAAQSDAKVLTMTSTPRLSVPVRLTPSFISAPHLPGLSSPVPPPPPSVPPAVLPGISPYLPTGALGALACTPRPPLLVDVATPPGSSSFPLAVPSTAIEPPLRGPLMDVLGTIVALGHGDPSSRGLFSGLEAINAALAVTLRESTLQTSLSKLKKVHHIYVRMLAWTVDVLGESCRTALTLPELYVPEDIFCFSRSQREALEVAFGAVDNRLAPARPDSRPFGSASFSTLRACLQGRNQSRRRSVAIDKLQSPIFKNKASAARAHWRKTYNLVA